MPPFENAASHRVPAVPITNPAYFPLAVEVRDMEHATELGHVHLKVRDVDRAVEFYCDVLGLDVTERASRFAFLSFGSEALRTSDDASGETASNEHHHDLALQGLGTDAASRGDEPLDRAEAQDASRGPEPGVGLYHAAFEVPDAEALEATYRRLRDRDVSVSPVDHGISKALYFDDPDGNGLEVYLDTRESEDEWRWEGRNDSFDPESVAD
jgi:catechol 2,3-dioxygenase